MNMMLINVTDYILFFYLLIEVVYLLTLGSVAKSSIFNSAPDRFFRYAVFIPNGFIFPSQNYISDYYQVFFYKSWRNKLRELDAEAFDEVIVLGPFKKIPIDLLSKLNIANNEGFKALQLHTVLDDNRTYQLRRKARLEELRNGLMKSGRCGWGLSSAMDKENFVVPLKWTQNNLKTDRTNLEWRLISQKVFIKYMSEPFIVADSFPEHFKQRPFLKAFKRLKLSLITGDLEEMERGLVRLFPSYTTLIILLTCLAIGMIFLDPYRSIKWWILWYFTFFAFSLAMPDYVMEPHKRKMKLKNIIALWKNRL